MRNHVGDRVLLTKHNVLAFCSLLQNNIESQRAEVVRTNQFEINIIILGIIFRINLPDSNIEGSRKNGLLLIMETIYISFRIRYLSLNLHTAVIRESLGERSGSILEILIGSQDPAIGIIHIHIRKCIGLAQLNILSRCIGLQNVKIKTVFRIH